MAVKEFIVSTRVDRATFAYVSAQAEKRNVTNGVVVREMLKIAAENKVELTERLERKRKQFTELSDMEDHDAQIRLLTKKAFLFNNAKQLMVRMSASGGISEKYARETVAAMQLKIKMVYGENSKEFREASKWLESKK